MNEENKNTHEENPAPVSLKLAKKSFPLGGVILIGALIIGLAIYMSNSNKQPTKNGEQKSVIERMNINKKELAQCFEEKRTEKKIEEDILSAKAIDIQGTPFSIILGPDNKQMVIPGAYPVEAVKGMLNSMLDGTATEYTSLPIKPVTEADHYYGSKDAKIVIIEYSDLECPFCARFHQTMMTILKDYNGEVAWVYRHFPLEQIHPYARDKAITAECIFDQKGDEGFFAYIDETFEKMTPKPKAFDPFSGEVVEQQ